MVLGTPAAAYGVGLSETEGITVTNQVSAQVSRSAILCKASLCSPAAQWEVWTLLDEG